MKQTIAGDKTTKEKSKKGGILLCAKKNPKKKKKKVPNSAAYNDGGYPLYSTNTVDGEFCYLVHCVLYRPDMYISVCARRACTCAFSGKVNLPG